MNLGVAALNGRSAVVLLSGGLDSTTTLAMARHHGFIIYALSLDYGQRHSVELKAAKIIAEQAQVKEHVVISVDLRKVGGSALTSSDIEVPKYPPISSERREIPVTYVPARNTVFLSLALAVAEVKNAGDIFIGVNAVDYSGYPDCRLEYIRAFESMANLATKASIEGRKISIHTPLIQMTKAEIIKAGNSLGVDYSLTVSCYDLSLKGEACGACESCRIRRNGFEEAGVPDPAAVAKEVIRGQR